MYCFVHSHSSCGHKLILLLFWVLQSNLLKDLSTAALCSVNIKITTGKYYTLISFFFNATCFFVKNREKRPKKRELSKHSLVRRVKNIFKVLTALRCSQFERISEIVLTLVTYLHKIECWYNERGLSNQQHS